MLTGTSVNFTKKTKEAKSMNAIQTVTINSTDIAVKEYNGKRVVTFKDIDACHERPEGTARKRFNDNKYRFIEGEDYFTINQPSEIRTLGITRPQGGVPDKVTVVTESGYLMLVKSFTDELAWQIQRMLVNTYFRTRAITPEEEFNRQIKLAEINIKTLRAKAMYINACTRHMKESGARFKDTGLSPESIKTAAIKSLEEITGDSLGSILPQVEKTYTATELGTEFGVSAHKIGKLANDNGLKTAEYGMLVMDKAKGSSKDVQTFRYNEKGRARLAELLGAAMTD